MNKVISTYSVLILCILSIITMAFYYKYSRMKADLIPETQKYLETVLNERSKEIYIYLDQQEKLVNELAKNPKIVAIFTGNTDNVDSNKFELVTKLYNELVHIKNILFVQNNGKIITSIKNQEELQGKNLLDAKWQSEMSESFVRSSMTLTTDISGYEFNELIDKAGLFITVPIITNNTLYGCIMVELDIEPIYFILRKYIGLKTTGEVTLGKIEDGEILYVAPSRHNPNMLFKILESQSGDNHGIKHTMRNAIFGKKGSGQAIDYRNENVIAAWSFLTRINWGIVAKIDTQEVLAPLNIWYIFFLIALISTLLLGIILCIYLRKKIISYMHIPTISSSKIIHTLFLIGFILSIISACWSMYQLTKNKKLVINNAINNAQQKIKKAANLINNNFERIEAIAQLLADDIGNKKLSDELLEKRIRTELQEYPALIEITIAYEPYTYNKNDRLYSFSIANINGKLTKVRLDDIYDYTKPAQPGEPRTQWYTQAIKEGPMWLDPVLESITQIPSIIYSVPFFSEDKKPYGVVSISYAISEAQKIINDIEIGKTGYGLATSHNGTLVAYPIKSYVQNLLSFTALAQEKSDTKLMAIAERVIHEKKPFCDNFFDIKTNQQYFICIDQIPKTGWSVAVIFAKDEITLSPLIVRHNHFFIIACLILGLLCLAAFGCTLEQNILSVIRKFAIFATIILFIALLAIWNIIIKTNTSTSFESQINDTIIVDQSRLDKFLNKVKANISRSHSNEPYPLLMPTGIYIYSFSLPKIQHISLSGNLWQKIDLSLFQNVPKEIQFPKDIGLTFKDLTKTIEGNTEIRVTTFDTTIYNEQNFSHFPFDVTTIRLNLSSQDLTRNIILVPDLFSYDSINPKDKPGMDKDFSLPGFKIQSTFFSLKKIIHDHDFGLSTFRTITEHYDLIYNIIITRNLLNSFIIYILPLLVILIALFATLFGIREKKEGHDPLKPLAAYASLFFGLIILHRTIREQYGITNILYIEYAFFYTYVTILLLVIHGVIVYGPNSNKTFDTIITPLMLYFYWPVQLMLWLTTTLYIFS